MYVYIYIGIYIYIYIYIYLITKHLKFCFISICKNGNTINFQTPFC